MNHTDRILSQHLERYIFKNTVINISIIGALFLVFADAKFCEP